MGPLVSALYGVVCYLVFLGAFLYSIGFVGNFLVPKSIDSGPAPALSVALLVNTTLLGIFAVQHSVMARPTFKRWWVRFVPQPVERSTYVLLSSLILLLLFWQWRPMPDVIWDVTAPAVRGLLWTLFTTGWLVVLASTFMINHFDLFGLRQVWLHLRARSYTPVHFRMTLLYRLVRHPIMLGFLVAFWATATMTAGHLLFALATTGYVLIALQLEERDLVAHLGESYRDYKRRVPMLLPWPRRRT